MTRSSASGRAAAALEAQGRPSSAGRLSASTRIAGGDGALPEPDGELRETLVRLARSLASQMARTGHRAMVARMATKGAAASGAPAKGRRRRTAVGNA